LVGDSWTVLDLPIMSQLQEWYLTKTLASDYTASDCTPATPAQ